jgi:hypothetical protein
MLRDFPRQIYLAVTDFEFYGRVFQQSFQRTLVFLLFAATVVAALQTLIYAWVLFPELDRFVDWGRTALPPFSVVGGELSVDADQPLVTKFDAEGPSDWTFVFDTTGAYKDPYGLEEPAFVFGDKDLSVQMEGQSQAYPWNDFGDFSFAPDQLGAYGTLLKWGYFPAAYSLLLLWNLFAKALTAAFLSPMAYSIGLSYGVRLPYSNCFTITSYSLVPAICIDLAVRMTGVEISYFNLIYLGVVAVYTFFATQRCVVAH